MQHIARLVIHAVFAPFLRILIFMRHVLPKIKVMRLVLFVTMVFRTCQTDMQGLCQFLEKQHLRHSTVKDKAGIQGMV